MAFVKLDTGILQSTLWFDRDAREVFLTALLMAEPMELPVERPQIEVRTLKSTGWIVPAGWYGFVGAAGAGIVRMCGMDNEAGLVALERLGSPEENSRTPDFDGRRLVRIEGGFIVLNYMKYRDRDYTGALRQKRYRDRQLSRNAVTNDSDAVTGRHVTQAEAEAEGELEAKKGTTRAGERAIPSNVEEVRTYWAEAKLAGDADAFFDHFTANGWVQSSGQRIKDWKAACRNWSRREVASPSPRKSAPVVASPAAARALPSGDVKLASGWLAASDGSWIQTGSGYDTDRYSRVNMGRYLNGERFYVTGASAQNTAYGPDIKEAEKRILAGHPLFEELFK